MMQTVGIILPVFGLIALGYGLAVSRILPINTGQALSDFVFKIAMPLFLFRKLATADFIADVPWSLWGAYFSGVLVSWVMGQGVIRYVFHRDMRSGVIGGLACGYANPVLVGLPVIFTAYGDEGAVPALLLISIHLPLMMLISAILMERAAMLDGETDLVKGRLATLKRVMVSVLKNPIIIGILSGGLWHFLGWPISEVADDVLGRVAVTGVPLALISIGMVMQSYGLSRNVIQAFALLPIKLLVMPLVVLIACLTVFDLSPLWTKVVVLLAAAPTGVNVYLMANHFRTGHALASNAVSLSTGLAALSVGLWFNLVEML